MRFKLTIEYAGTRYSGWQIQKNARTVQGEIDRAIREVSGKRGFELYGSGRTDAGVHALAQVAHLDLSTTVPPETLRRRLNDALPADINILAIEPAARTFHARHDAVARTYLYQIARRRTAFGKALVWWVKDDLEIAPMRRAAASFVGLKNFESFTADDPGEKSTRVLVEQLTIDEAGDLVVIRIDGSHFLWKMVRRLAGVLVEVGRGALAASEAASFLSQPSGVPAELTAPPSGLFLAKVYYPGEPRAACVEPVISLGRVQGNPGSAARRQSG
jgi:tRNA pseudouridine38-40 synthase